MRTQVIGAALALLSFATPAHAEGRAPLVVVADVEKSYGPFIACGILHVVGEFDFHVQRVVKGRLGVDRIVVEVSCPSDWEVHAVQELRLTDRRPSTWPSIAHNSKRPDRWYLVGSEPR